MVSKRGTYREGCHRKGINIALFRRAEPIGARVARRETFWGHMSESFRLMEPQCGTFDRNCKVSETRLTVPSDQDVVLDVLSIGVGVHSIVHLPTGLMLPCITPADL